VPLVDSVNLMSAATDKQAALVFHDPRISHRPFLTGAALFPDGQGAAARAGGSPLRVLAVGREVLKELAQGPFIVVKFVQHECGRDGSLFDACRIGTCPHLADRRADMHDP
jgi:hypothetical protein